MAKVERFEDVVVWQKARAVTARIYEVTSDGSSKDSGLRDQIRRSSVSIMANISEGFGRRSDKEFSGFLNFAHGSAAETQSHLYIARDLGYLNDDDFRALYGQLDEVSRTLMGLTEHLRKTS